jgi:Fic family protein
MEYLWQHPDWPNFRYDQQSPQIQSSILTFAQESSRIEGAVSQLADTLQFDAYIDIILNEAISTSQIEGESLNRESVRSSIKYYLGLEANGTINRDLKADGIANLMVDVRQSIGRELTHQKLYQWQTMALPQISLLYNPTVGQYRSGIDEMRIVSGSIHDPKVHYIAPPSASVSYEMKRFLLWYNATDRAVNSGPIKAALAHLYFELIHPFEDGNGRVGRAIAEHAIGRYLGYPPLLSLSGTILKGSGEYYNQLEKACGPNLDVTQWVEYFTDLLLNAQIDANQKVEFTLSKARFYQTHNDSPLNERQKIGIKKMFEAGKDGFDNGINAGKYGNLVGCSKATATRDLTDMLKLGVFIRLPGEGRNVRYALALSYSDIKVSNNLPEDFSKSDQAFVVAQKERILRGVDALLPKVDNNPKLIDSLQALVTQFEEYCAEDKAPLTRLLEKISCFPDIESKLHFQVSIHDGRPPVI